MFSFIWKLIPKDYKFSVAFKKSGQMAGKALVGFVVGTKVGRQLSPEHLQAVELAIGVLATAGLEWIHDLARMKWPNAKWL